MRSLVSRLRPSFNWCIKTVSNVKKKKKWNTDLKSKTSFSLTLSILGWCYLLSLTHNVLFILFISFFIYDCVPYSHTNIFIDFYLLMLLFFLLCHSDEKGRGQQKKNGQQLEFNCLSPRVVYSNQAVWETWMDRCMLGDSTGLQSEAYCELCPHTESHTVCPSHKQIALRPQPLLFDETGNTIGCIRQTR